MKKIIVMAMAICATALLNAATMQWGSNSTGIILADGSTADGQVTMYLYEISQSDYEAFTGSAAQISSAVYNAYGTSSSNYMLDDWGATLLTDSRTFNTGNTAYAAVVFVYNDGTQDLYKGNIGAYEFKSSSDFQVADLDVNIGGTGLNQGATLTWTATPEPTSGLLLLLGMAGLALKRKRA